MQIRSLRWQAPRRFREFPFKRSHSGNCTAICILTSYAFRQNNCCSITVLRCRPMKLIPACRTPQVSLPNMASLFLPRNSRRQDIISFVFHNRQLRTQGPSSGLLPRVDRIGRHPVARISTLTSKNAHRRPRQTHEAPFLLAGASQHLITSPPGHPREERTWVDGVKGGAPLGLAALSENASPAQRGPRR